MAKLHMHMQEPSSHLGGLQDGQVLLTLSSWGFGRRVTLPLSVESPVKRGIPLFHRTGMLLSPLLMKRCLRQLFMPFSSLLWNDLTIRLHLTLYISFIHCLVPALVARSWLLALLLLYLMQTGGSIFWICYLVFWDIFFCPWMMVDCNPIHIQ